MAELNPNNAHLKSMREQWQKIVAILVAKFSHDREVVITASDVSKLATMFKDDMPCVVSHEQSDGIHITVVSMTEGRRLMCMRGMEEN